MTDRADAPYPKIEEKLLSVEDLADLPEESDIRRELVRGSMVCEPPPGIYHGNRAGRVFSILDDWVTSRSLGFVTVEGGFILERNPDTVRAPDVAFIAADRLEEGMAHGGRWFDGAPDLAVEVVSPSRTRRELDERVRDYLRAGTRLVWVIDPEAEVVEVHRPDEKTGRVGRRGMLTGGEVLPGLALLAARVLP